MNLPQGYEPHELPPDYDGPLFTEGQMQRHGDACALEAADMMLCMWNKPCGVSTAQKNFAIKLRNEQ